jgi:tRNA pseudouridine38-40 synthase
MGTQKTETPGLNVYALTLEYDGTGFSGWQRQPGCRTVESTLLAAIDATTGEQPALTAAGRTDAGAHAHGQVVGCPLGRAWDPRRLQAALNAHLPADVVVVDIAAATPTFHARFDAAARSYRYVVSAGNERCAICRQYAWCVRGPLDVDAMGRAAQALLGRHDFAAFGRSPRLDGTTVRTVNDISVLPLELQHDHPRRSQRTAVVLEVEADAFLYGMMRSIAGALVAVGAGRMPEHAVGTLLERGSAGRGAITVAPAHGLHQWRVTYPSLGRAA